MNRAGRTIAVVMLHGGCNMDCGFCVAENSLDRMSWAQATDLLRRLADSGFVNAVLGGGEPFAWSRLTELGAFAKDLGLEVQVGTNGVSLPPDFAALDCFDRYVLPIESAAPALHDAMRPLRGRSHHALILRRLEALRAAGRDVTVSTVVTAENVDMLPELGGWIAAYVAGGGRLHAWHLYRFIPEGRGGAVNAGRFYLEKDAYDAAVRTVRAAFPQITIFKRPDMYHSHDVDFFWREGGALRIGSRVWANLTV